MVSKALSLDPMEDWNEKWMMRQWRGGGRPRLSRLAAGGFEDVR